MVTVVIHEQLVKGLMKMKKVLDLVIVNTTLIQTRLTFVVAFHDGVFDVL